MRYLWLSWLLLACAVTAGDAPGTAPSIFIARQIITMHDQRPHATAVAVAGGEISWVGEASDIRRRFGDAASVDRRFADRVLLPGFVEPHLHPYIAGILLPMAFITPHAWQLPGREVPAVRGREAYLRRLTSVVEGLPPAEWAWSWGYHPLFHGDLSRADLDAIAPDRPLLVWHRSFHEIMLNSAAIAALEVDVESARSHRQVELERGRFYENGLKLLLPALTPHLLEPGRYLAALREARDIIHAGGITTVGDGAFGTLDLEQEWAALLAAGWDEAATPFRTQLLIDGKALGERHGHEHVAGMIRTLPERNRRRLRIAPEQVKLFADGAAYSQLMQMSEPYSDGHQGEWLMTPAQLRAAAEVYWRAGFQLHIHVNGDAGLDATLEVIEQLQRDTPRQGHRLTIHHLAYARPDQAQRLARLGGSVQANPYYLWALADVYAEHGLGRQRAAGMVPLGSFAATGMPIGLHSDFTMAPAQPLLLAWAAASRVSAGGQVLAPAERLSRQRALRAVTLDAAWQMGVEHEVGSIEVGKKADFVVLDGNPLTVPLEAMKDLAVLATVFEGRVYPR